MQGGARDELGDGHAEARRQHFPARKTARVDITRNLEHGRQMTMFHAARGVERRQTTGVSDRQYDASSAVLLDTDPAVECLTVLQSTSKGVTPGYGDSRVCHVD